MAYLNPNKLIILFLILGSLSKAQEKILYVIHSNNTNGALENCYCPDNPFGSLEIRSVYIENFKKVAAKLDSYTQMPINQRIVREVFYIQDLLAEVSKDVN